MGLEEHLMATAISILVIMTLSVIAVRAGSVALWLTGLPQDAARFQARSAFTTTGFTTPQASLVVNHPERRRIISVLMVLGNAGIISVGATVILSYVDFEATGTSLAQEALWLAAAAVVFWVVGLSKRSDRLMTRFIQSCLRGRVRPYSAIESLLLLPNGYQVAVLKAGDQSGTFADLLSRWRADERRITLLGLLHSDDGYVSLPPRDMLVQPTDRVILYGMTRDLEAVSE